VRSGGRVAAARCGGLLVLLALLGVQAVLRPASASAHASLVGSTPVDGSHLQRGPAEVTFRLDEAVSLVSGSPQVVDSAGRRHPVASAGLRDGRTVVALRLPAALPDGSYLATARLVSPDTHVVSVSAAFTVGDARTLLAAPADGGPSWEQLAAYPLRFAVYLGAAGSAGALLTTALLWPELRARRRWVRVYRGAGVLFVAGLLGRFATEAAQRAGGLSVGALADVFTANPAFAVATALAVAVAAATAARPLPAGVTALRALGVAGAVTAALAVTAGGHGAEAQWFPLPLVATAVHVFAVLAWLGGVIVIAAQWAEPARLDRWHRYAVAHVAVAVLAGAVLAALRVPAPAALPSTAYGVTLLVKSGVVVLVVVTAAVLHRRLATVPGRGPGRFLGVEVGLATGVLVATATLASVTPARASYDPPLATTLDFGRGAVLDVRIASTRRGAQTLVVSSQRPAAALSVDLSSREANVARLPVTLVGAGRERRSRDLVVPLAGAWQVTVTFDPGDGPRVASFPYLVR
jgi:copper transport protein